MVHSDANFFASFTSIPAGQQEIATTAQNEQWLICLCQQAHYLSGFLYRFILQKSAAFSINPECIVSQKAIVTNIIYGQKYTESNRKIFVIRGIANGMETSLTFKKIGGKWELIKLNM